jgi:hypothetical protein
MRFHRSSCVFGIHTFTCKVKASSAGWVESELPFMGSKQRYQSSTTLSFGEVKTEIKPEPQFADHHQALNAMSVAGHTTLTAWVIDNTLDRQPQDGHQERITVKIKSGQKILATADFDVPTTSNYSKGMFKSFIEQKIVPIMEGAARQYQIGSSSPSVTSSASDPLTEQIVSDGLQQTAQIKPMQLQTN